jgi:ribosomal protein S18 acetylase RimI-like enzyme
MISARPEVKRTYSRLNKELPCAELSEVAPKGVDCGVQTESLTVIVPVEFEVTKVDKMRKITDFFRVQREVDSTISPIKSTNTISIASSPVTSVANKMKQTFLDLGQKDLISSQCGECLMHFNKSFPDDVALHKKFHAQYLKGYNFNVKVDYVLCKEIAPEAGDEMTKWAKYRFYEIKEFEGNLVKKLEFFLNFVHIQLGAEPLTSIELKEPNRYTAIFAVEHLSLKIVGFVLFEKCKKVFRSRLDCDNSAIELDGLEVADVDIGISRIWVDSKHRTRGLASIMLDLKCGTQKRRNTLAFSQPTPAGFAFAKKYQSDFLEGRQCFIYLQ